MVALYLLLVLGILIFFYYASRRWKYGRLPPGPIGVPFLGSLPYLAKNIEIRLFELKSEYGNVMTVYLGSVPLVILNDWTTVKEALVTNANIFNGRPKMYLPEQIIGSKDIIFDEGPRWKAKRRICLGILRDFGFGKTLLEANIVEEILSMINSNCLEKDNQTEVTISKTFAISLLNIIWFIVAGQRLSADDTELQNINHDLEEISNAMLGSAAANIFPFLRFIPRFSGAEAIKFAKNIYKRIETIVDIHKNTYNPSECRDFIDGYLAKTTFQMDNNSSKSQIEYNDEEMRSIVNDLFGAALETTDTYLSWAILYLMEYQVVQKKVQNEIDSVIGPDRMPTYSERINLPYTLAVIAEIQRVASVVPLSVPYRTMKSCKFRGFDIPQGIQVWANLYAVHNDKALWGDPVNFRPERFINENNEFKEPEYLIPYSTGSRQCLGESVARMEIFLFLTIFLQRFNFKCPKNNKHSFERQTGLAAKPLPFNVIFEKRI